MDRRIGSIVGLTALLLMGPASCLMVDASDLEEIEDLGVGSNYELPEGKSHTEVIGPDGGSMEFEGARLTVPQGAMNQEWEVTIVEVDEPPAESSDYDAYSPVYLVFPSHHFDEPVTVEIAYEGDRDEAALYSKNPNRLPNHDYRYERIGGSADAGLVRAKLREPGFVFVGDGIRHQAVADTRCVETRTWHRPRLVGSSGVELVVGIDDCGGRPVTGLVAGDMVVFEDGDPAGGDKILVDSRQVELFVTLVVENTEATQDSVSEVVDGARAFVDELQAAGRSVQVGVKVLTGASELEVLQDFTPQFDDIRRALDELEAFGPDEVESTNLHGGLIDAYKSSQAGQDAFMEHNDGAYSLGHTVLFTEGSDTLGIEGDRDARLALRASRDELHVIALSESPDHDIDGIDDLAPHTFLRAFERSTLAREFRHLAHRIDAKRERTYVLGYCSSKRDGDVEVSVGHSDAEDHRVDGQDQQFDARGFDDGCSNSDF